MACRGYHTLNRASTDRHGKQIGDCMVEVRWSRRYGRSRRVLTDFNMWETGEDREGFRGIRCVRWEIYYFAKCRENGQYPQDVESCVNLVAKQNLKREGFWDSETIGSGRFVYSDTEDEEEADDDTEPSDDAGSSGDAESSDDTESQDDSS